MKRIRFAFIFEGDDYTAWFSLDDKLPVRVCLAGKKEEDYDNPTFWGHVKWEMQCRVPQMREVDIQQWYYTFLGETDDTFREWIGKIADPYQIEYIPEGEIEQEILSRNIPLALSEENYAKALFHMIRWNDGAPDDKLLFVLDAGRSDHPVYVYELGESQRWDGPRWLDGMYAADGNCLYRSAGRQESFCQIENQIYEKRPWFWESDPNGHMHYRHLWYVGYPYGEIVGETLGKELECQTVRTDLAVYNYQKKDGKSWESGALLFLISEDCVETMFCRNQDAEPEIKCWSGGVGRMDQAILENVLHLQKHIPKEEMNSPEVLGQIRDKAAEDPILYRRLLRECRVIRREFQRKKQECCDFEEMAPLCRKLASDVTGVGELGIYLSEALWNEIYESWKLEWKVFLQKIAEWTEDYHGTVGVPLYIKGHFADCRLAEEEICRAFDRAMVMTEISGYESVAAIADYAITKEYSKMLEERFALIRSLRCVNEAEEIEDPVIFMSRKILTETVEKINRNVSEKTEKFLTDALLESEKYAWTNSTRYNRLTKKMEKSLRDWIGKDEEPQTEGTDRFLAEILRISGTGQKKMTAFLDITYGELWEGCKGFERKEMEQYFTSALFEILRKYYYSQKTYLKEYSSRTEECIMTGWYHFLYQEICKEQPESVELPRKDMWTEWKNTWKKDVDIRIREILYGRQKEDAVYELSQKVIAFLESLKEEKIGLLRTEYN